MMEPIDEYIGKLAAAATGCREIWLIGSRANGTAKPDSDWDLLVFGDSQSLAQITAAESLHRDDVDCLVMVDENEFRSAWGDKLKSGSLSNWEWRQTSDTAAEYAEVKWQEAEGSTGPRCLRKRALLRWTVP